MEYNNGMAVAIRRFKQQYFEIDVAFCKNVHVAPPHYHLPYAGEVKTSVGSMIGGYKILYFDMHVKILSYSVEWPGTTTPKWQNS